MEEKVTGYPSVDKPWLKYYTAEMAQMPAPSSTIYEYLWENNKAHLKEAAIEYLGTVLPFGELFKKIDECAKALNALDVRPGDIVTVALPCVPEALYLVYALNKIGAVANMIHPLAGEKEIIHYLNEVNSKVAVLFDRTYSIIEKSLHTTCVNTAVIVSAADSMPFGLKQLYLMKNKMPNITGSNMLMTWKQFIRKGQNTVVKAIKKDIMSVAIISHTGGTTGEPKGVMCSDRNINAYICQIGFSLPHKRQDRYLVILPPFINYSLTNMMLGLTYGFRLVLIPSYDPTKFDEYIKKYRPAFCSSVPAYLEALLVNEKLKKMDLSCLRYIMYGGDAMNTKKEEELNELLLSRGVQNPVGKGLGATEIVAAATITTGTTNLIGSVGAPMVHVNCKIVEPGTETECHYNQEGEICFSGETLMIGYYNKPEATDAIIKIHSDGQRWLHTGDLGYMNEDGVLFVSGRIKRIIMTKGKDGNVTKMFPDRMEKAVLLHAAVGLCCTIGIPDEERINYARAYVVLNSGYIQTPQLIEEILANCTEVLPEYMIPDEIVFRDDLPRTDRGKVDYRALEHEAIAN